eukprot:CAMPEP_0177441448 /NCGR_PEP_ID=MMETSP0369-20130122/4411_1 /TAXON_ID=447022 ORGANISM="Scrippsiella hangoei-like, Strain SHHI-4" /NCGR_SAMPLE_ID=MMETSP0369 /ASSEMBLY_ACC=CAM_ASM_000364 /LENGTH=88 /DNA_ID=CAMNT_0018913317 /DNA_START=59 /DNA_END=323 /DNA_ORIENTATION=+
MTQLKLLTPPSARAKNSASVKKNTGCDCIGGLHRIASDTRRGVPNCSRNVSQDTDHTYIIAEHVAPHRSHAGNAPHMPSLSASEGPPS